MIKIVCDNCGKELREGKENMNPNAKPEKRVTLKMHIEGTASYPIDMDLCVRCAKQYVAKLNEPL